MKTLTLKRLRLPTEQEKRAIDAILDSPYGGELALNAVQRTLSGEVRYEVIKVVGSVDPYVGELLKLDYVDNLCGQGNNWTVTFI